MPLVIQATPWPLSCQGTRAAPESELAQLLPWSKESETLPLETKQSIHHFSCQEYIQPKKKYCLLNSQQQKPSISPAKQSPASCLSVISTQVPIVCSVAELKTPRNKRSRGAGLGPAGPGLREGWEEGDGADRAGMAGGDPWAPPRMLGQKLSGWEKRTQVSEPGLEGPNRADRQGAKRRRRLLRAPLQGGCPLNAPRARCQRPPCPGATPCPAGRRPAFPVPSPGKGDAHSQPGPAPSTGTPT